MRLENTDRFRNKYCKVIWKDNSIYYGIVKYVPNYSAKYEYHQVGWFLSNNNFEIEIRFKDVKEIIVEE